MKFYKFFAFAIIMTISVHSYSQMKYTSSGYLGLGTGSPSTILHIKSTYPTLKVETSQASGGGIIRINEHYGYRGGFIKYEGSTSLFTIGVHSAWDSNSSNDKNTLQINASSGRIDYNPTTSTTYSPTLVTNALSDYVKCYVVYRSGVDKFHVRGNGDIYIRSSYHASDLSFKEDIANLSGSMDLLTQLRPVKYKFKSDSGDSTKDEDYSFGLIAQEVEEVIPEIVSMQDSVYKAVNYTALIPFLIDALKTQQEDIDELEAQISESASSYKSSMIQTSTEDLEELSSASLFQNVPNPFNYNTTIEYYIPTIESYAMINVYDLNGTQIRSFNLAQTGNGEIVIPASELDPGLFIYNLIVDGKEIDSKRMVLTDR